MLEFHYIPYLLIANSILITIWIIVNGLYHLSPFQVRVRNHAKMVDCYLNTYYNHKSLFGNKKRVADTIIENPQNYHIYEGLSTLTNISRYDLPDPEVYRDFFRLNPLYEFKKLAETCSYFRGCPITKLDVAIAYDLPDLVGKYKRMAETALANVGQKEASATATATGGETNEADKNKKTKSWVNISKWIIIQLPNLKQQKIKLKK